MHRRKHMTCHLTAVFLVNFLHHLSQKLDKSMKLMNQTVLSSMEACLCTTVLCSVRVFFD